MEHNHHHADHHDHSGSPEKTGLATQPVRETFPVLGMSCASCAVSVESVLKDTPGVKDAVVNFVNKKVAVTYQPGETSPAKLQDAIKTIGYDLVVPKAPAHAGHAHTMPDGTVMEGMDHEGHEDHAMHAEALEGAALKQLYRDAAGALVFALPVFVIGMFLHDRFHSSAYWMLVLTTPVMWFGRRFFVTGLKRIRYGQVNMDTLVALSTGIAYLFSAVNTLYPQWLTNRGLEAPVYFEAASVVIAFILLGKVLEERAKRSAGSAIKSLMGLAPKSVRVKLPDGTTPEVLVAKLKVGDVVLARAGEKIAVDGIVVAGESHVDEATITGESLPVKKLPGNKVFSGTLNGQGSIEYRAEKVGSETLLAQIIKTVEEAQGSKPPVQKLVDRISAIFVPLVIALAVFTFLAWQIFGGEGAISHGLAAAISVLVIACPCALGLATPTAIMVGVGKGAQSGILVRDAEAMELARLVNTVVLDKTGTLTEGRPAVTDQIWLDTLSARDKDHLRQALLAVELRSEHPLAKAIVAQLETEQIKPLPDQAVTRFESVTAAGVKLQLHGSEWLMVGNLRLLQADNIELSDQLRRDAEKLEADAKTVVFVAFQGKAVAVIAIADPLKETSANAIATLKRSGIDVHMLTGDNEKTAAAVAGQVGIESYKAQVLPADKSAFIRMLRDQGKTVAMVGDGVNDSEALALANVSIAMGHGSDVAMQVASLTLMTGNLEAVSKAIRLSNLTVATIKRNLFWAFIYNIVAIPVAAGVLYPVNGYLLDPMLAGGAMALSSVSVVLSSLYLRSQKL